jgi:hypothetical protein
MLLKGRMRVVFLQCKLGIHVCNTNLEFILQVTVKLISLLNLVNFMEFSDSLVIFCGF